MNTTTDTGAYTRVLAAVVGLWILMRSITSDSTGRTLIDHLLGRKASKSPLLSTPIVQGTTSISSAVSSAAATVAGATGLGGRYVNPVSGFNLGRTDQGVDASAQPGTPIRALGASRLVSVVGDWFQGQPLLLFQLLSGPMRGQYWYVAEQINPASTKIGQVFQSGDPVGTFASSGTGIEIGWGSPNTPHRTLATAPGHGGYTEGQVTPEGTSFRNFLAGL